MRLDDLDILCAVITHGGIARAAARLHRVPSGVTARIQELERELSRPLFFREGGRLVPTPAGTVAAVHAQRVLAEVKGLRAAVTGGGVPQRLRIGTMESTAALYMPAALARLQQQHPETEVELRVGTGRHVTAALLVGDLDAVLVADLVPDPRLASVLMFSDTLVLVAPAHHPPIRSPADVTRPALVVFQEGCAYRARLEAWCQRGHLVPNRLIEVGSFFAILGCVAASMGIALVPQALVDIHPGKAHISVHPLPPTLRRIRHALAWRADRPSEAIGWFRKAFAYGPER